MDEVADRNSQPLVSLLREHPALLLTAGYLALIILGLLFEVVLFLGFKVNILYYAEAADFLLVPFREPLLMVVSLAPIPLWNLYMRFSKWMEGRSSVMQRWRERGITQYGEARYNRIQRWAGVLGTVLWSLAFTLHYSNMVADQIRNGQRRSVRVETTSLTIQGPMIGSTAQFLFIFDVAKQETHIVPVEAVSQITIDSKRKKRK